MGQPTATITSTWTGLNGLVLTCLDMDREEVEIMLHLLSGAAACRLMQELIIDGI